MLNLTTIQKDVSLYRINLVNQGANAQNFWCFLDSPIVSTGTTVYANSTIMLNVAPNYKGNNSFLVPVQYQVGAGASNDAVGLNVKIDSSYMKDAELEQSFDFDYCTVPPPQAPNITDGTDPSSEGTITVQINNFDQVKNENANWFSSMSFGIETSNGFTGLTWSPSPGTAIKITPQFSFYIATGDYAASTLAEITTISSNAATVTEADFQSKDGEFEVTVTLLSNGEWKVGN